MLHFREEVYAYTGQTMVVDELLFAGRSEYQEILLFKNSFFGHVLVLDGIVQLSERDEFIYSEMLAHVPLFAHPNPRRVLIVGGGDGCVLKEVLKHAVEKVVLVDIDATVIDLCRRHFAAGNHRSFEDPRAEVLITDGIRYVRETPDRFDVILVDGPDPIEPDAAGASLYTAEFYRLCAGKLNPGGMFLIQSDVPFHNPDAMRLTYGALSSVFRNVQVYTVPVPCYLGGFMCFVLSSNDCMDASSPLHAGPVDAAIPGLGYYTREIHKAAIQLPPYIAALTAGAHAEVG